MADEEAPRADSARKPLASGSRSDSSSGQLFAGPREQTGLPFDTPGDDELVTKMYTHVLFLSSTVLTLFLIAAYAAMSAHRSVLGAFDSLFALRFVLLANVLCFPLVAMVLIVGMAREYVMREWFYYRLLGHRLIVDFENRELLSNFVYTSSVAWYVCVSTLLLFAVIRLQPAPLLAAAALSGKLLSQIYSLRQLEVRLVSLNKVLEHQPQLALQFVQTIVAGSRRRPEASARRLVLRIKLARARAGIAGSEEWYAPWLARGTIAEQVEAVEAASGAASTDDSEERAPLLLSFDRLAKALAAAAPEDESAESEAFREDVRPLDWPRRLSHVVLDNLWATCGPELFREPVDRDFVRHVQIAYRLCIGAALLINLYGAMRTGLGAGAGGCVVGHGPHHYAMGQAADANIGMANGVFWAHAGGNGE
jgi:hypothetical protein